MWGAEIAQHVRNFFVHECCCISAGYLVASKNLHAFLLTGQKYLLMYWAVFLL